MPRRHPGQAHMQLLPATIQTVLRRVRAGQEGAAPGRWGQALSDLRQDDIEGWLSAHPGRRSYLINGFLKWANSRGLARQITVATPPRDDPANFLDDDRRWHELHRCLTDDRLSVPARVAGALLFLYGSSQTGTHPPRTHLSLIALSPTAALF